MMSYPVAFWGFVTCFAILTGFAVLAGVRLDIALTLWICYLAFAIALTRVAVEGGLLFLLHDSAPIGALSASATGRRHGLAFAQKRIDARRADSGRFHHSYARFYHAVVFARV